MTKRLTRKDIEEVVRASELELAHDRRKRYLHRSILAFICGIIAFLVARLAGIPHWLEVVVGTSPFIATAIDLLFYSGLE